MDFRKTTFILGMAAYLMARCSTKKIVFVRASGSFNQLTETSMLLPVQTQQYDFSKNYISENMPY
jgi:hypothetical protein